MLAAFNCDWKESQRIGGGEGEKLCWRERESWPDLHGSTALEIAFYKKLNLRDMPALSAEKGGDFKLTCVTLKFWQREVVQKISSS
jgi:hypothetical protein